MKLKKYEGNPILKPNHDNAWESLAVLNPGAWHEKNTFYLLYRAAGNDTEHYIHLGLATSTDGFQFTRVYDRPVCSPTPDGPDAGSIEDPRIVKYGDAFHITYAYRPYYAGKYWKLPPGRSQKHDIPRGAPEYLKENMTETGLLLSRDLRTFKRLGRITHSGIDDRDVILFPETVNGKYITLHRPMQWCGSGYDCAYPSIWISVSDTLLEPGKMKLLAKNILPG